LGLLGFWLDFHSALDAVTSKDMSASGNKIMLPALIIASLIGIVLLQSGFIFLLIALLPAMVAYFIDRDEHKSAFRVILLCNVAALLPSLFPMLASAMRMERYDVMKLMTDPTVWLIIYAGATMGWGLIFLCRLIARFIIMLYFDYQIGALERFQKKLLIEWGDRIKEEDAKAAK
jgi:hypothetical protein